MRPIPTRPLEGNHGLTLLELIVALALATVVSVALISTFTAFSRSQTAQSNILAMQQNLRAALYLMGRDLRMAGYRGPDPASAPAAGFTAATSNALTFTMVNDDTNTLDAVTYDFVDSDGNGTKDVIRRSDATTTNAVVAEDIDGVEFYYTLDGGSQTIAPTAGDLAAIRSVTITVLARAHRNDREFSNTETYTTASLATWGPFNDGRRRRLEQSVIRFRNM